MHPTAGQELRFRGRGLADIHEKSGSLRVYRLEAVCHGTSHRQWRAIAKAPRSAGMTIQILSSKGSRKPSVQPSFQRPPSLDLLRQDLLNASVTGGSDIPIVQRAACPRSSCGRLLPCRCPSLAPNHPHVASAVTRRPPPQSVCLSCSGPRRWSRPRVCQWYTELVNGRRGTAPGPRSLWLQCHRWT